MKKLLAILSLLLVTTVTYAQQYIYANLVVEGWTWTADTVFLGIDRNSCYLVRSADTVIFHGRRLKSTHSIFATDTVYGAVGQYSGAVNAGSFYTAGSINAGTSIQLANVNINTTGTLTNVAYLGAVTNAFIGRQTATDFIASDTIRAITFYDGTTTITGGQYRSTLPTGTKPFSIVSSTLNDSLNADYLDGYHASHFQPLISPAALTKVDDTNITLTLGGTPNTALLQAVSITAGWTGQLAVGRGGTGASTFTSHGVLLGNATGAIGATAEGATGTYLAGNTGANPSFATLNQAAVAGLTTASSPAFVTVKLSGLTDGYVPYHVSDATGLANSTLFISGTSVGLGTPTPDLFLRYYTTVFGLNSAGSTAIEINGATGNSVSIDFGINSSRTAGIVSNVNETTFGTIGSTPVRIETNSVERARFFGGGNFTVGGVTTDYGSQLQVASSTGLTEFSIINTAEGVDAKKWSWQMGSSAGSNLLRLRAGNDALSSGTNALVFTRSGYTITNAYFPNGDVFVGFTANPLNYKFAVNGTSYFSDDVALAYGAWLQGYDASGFLINMFSIAADGTINPGSTINISALNILPDAGIVNIADLAVTSDSPYGTVNAINITIAGAENIRFGTYADGAGGIYGRFNELAGNIIYTPANTGTITAAGGIPYALLSADMRYTTAAAIDISSDPQIADGNDGMTIKIIGLSDANTLTLEDGTGLQLAGGAAMVLGVGDVICLTYVLSLDLWVEVSRSNN